LNGGRAEPPDSGEWSDGSRVTWLRERERKREEKREKEKGGGRKGCVTV
jgi:hypothetical protein